MSDIITTFLDRRMDWLIALGQHIQISLLALIVSIAIALPLAFLLQRWKRTSDIAVQIAAIFQTIPSLALLGLFIPIMGIGTVPAVTALVIYAIFPILQNTLTGLNQIDPQLEEAGEAFGMNEWEKLKTYRIALAMPVIMAGVRLSAVMIIGTATLAALIGAGGLGSFILLGIDRNNTALILIGALSSAILAIIAHYGINWMSKFKARNIFISFLVIVLGLSASYAAPAVVNNMQTQGSKHLVIAGKLGSEPEILMNMYKDLIEANSDISVEVKPNFGKTTFVYNALKSGKVDIYPEFTGTVTSSLLKNPPATSTDSRTVYEQARDGLLKQDHIVMLEPMKYQNTYAITVKNDYAKENGLETISDLAKVQDSARAGFTLEFNDREDGGKGLTSVYGLHLNVATMEPSLRYQAINNGDVQIVDGYSTDSQIAEYDLKILQDDKHLFPPYQGAPVLREETLKQYPELKGILNKLAGKISEAQMSQMNYDVNVKGMSAATVARNYLRKEHLLK
ncbi:ABC transporter permease/substrate-binding protein [Alloscardovia theropitheci]|uniref:ABC transporter permease/substrate-binding protein n=1 Tax=Alloscardovia theropitheci TaxID=2496842 RepID=A0A4R0QR84_9BIFI|nr:ABC transporter permease/substrate-binding protein [Alloscardovia theropitheci]TCD54854.1 ABC transporter permease/substrate-binding protein [Alloscardovia theropitheci]